MPIPTFKDVHNYNPGAGYPVTNEEPEAFRKLLGKRHFNKAGAILSSGEVLLSVILPRSKEVVAVDHSYNSIAIAMLKAILLDMLGPKEMRALLSCMEYEAAVPKLKEAVNALPMVLQTHTGMNTQQLKINWPSIKTEWNLISSGTLLKSRHRLDRVTVLHGDIEDLGTVGPFDLLYMSNAMDHAGRGNKSPSFDTFGKLLQPNGILLRATSSYNNGYNPTAAANSWKKLDQMAGRRSTSWVYQIFEKKV